MKKPPQNDGEKISVTFEAPRALVDRLELEAKESQRPRSWVIRRLLLRALETPPESTR